MKAQISLEFLLLLSLISMLILLSFSIFSTFYPKLKDAENMVKFRRFASEVLFYSKVLEPGSTVMLESEVPRGVRVVVREGRVLLVCDNAQVELEKPLLILGDSGLLEVQEDGTLVIK